MNKSWDKMSTGLKKGIESITQEQSVIFTQQKAWHTDTMNQFQEVHAVNVELSVALHQNIQSAQKIAESQDNLHAGIIEVQKEQIKSHTMIQDTLSSQAEII